MDSIANRLSTSFTGAYASTYAPFATSPPPRRSSTTAMPQSTPSPDRERRSSTPSTHNAALNPVRTRSLGGFLSAGVIFERDPTNPPSDDDIIIVTVRVTKKLRRNSFDDPLPDR